MTAKHLTTAWMIIIFFAPVSFAAGGGSVDDDHQIIHTQDGHQTGVRIDEAASGVLEDDIAGDDVAIRVLG